MTQQAVEKTKKIEDNKHCSKCWTGQNLSRCVNKNCTCHISDKKKNLISRIEEICVNNSVNPIESGNIVDQLLSLIDEEKQTAYDKGYTKGSCEVLDVCTALHGNRSGVLVTNHLEEK